VVDVAAAQEVILSDNGHAGPHPQSRCVDDPV
jgi:hypothetical protein